jgi:hypothetical protein
MNTDAEWFHRLFAWVAGTRPAMTVVGWYFQKRTALVLPTPQLL